MLASALLPTMVWATTPAVESPPPLPAEPAAGAPCSNTPTAAGTWTQISKAFYSGGDQIDAGITVDPASPCAVYRLDTDRQTVEQQTAASPESWTQIFHDDAQAQFAISDCPATSPLGPIIGSDPRCRAPFEVSDLGVAPDRSIWLGEDRNGDAVVRRGPAGNWSLADRGVATHTVTDLLLTSDPAVAYAVALDSSTPWEPGLGTAYPTESFYTTRDSGKTWSAVTLPSYTTPGLASTPVQPVSSIDIDPTDPGHLVVMECPMGPPVVFESTDHGATWSTLIGSGSALPSGPMPAQIVKQVVRLLPTPAHPHRLALGGCGVPLSTTDDRGASFHVAAMPSGMGWWEVEASPGDADRVMVVDDQAAPKMRVAYSADGLRTISEVSNPNGWLQPHMDRLFATGDSSECCYFQHAIQTDSRGSFYVSLTSRATDPGSTTTERSLWRFDPPLANQPSQGPAAPAEAGPPINAVKAVLNCATTAGSAVAVTDSASATNYGSLAYDGRDLLFTQYGDRGALTDPPDEALIRRMDPLTCANRPGIIVHFDPGDLAATQSVYPPGNTADETHPSIDNMTYDARRNVLWFVLTDNSNAHGFSHFNGYGSGPPGLFRAVITRPSTSTQPAEATARLVSLQGCAGQLAYDYNDDSLWTCGAWPQQGYSASYPNVSHLRAGDLSMLGGCMGAVLDWGPGNVGLAASAPGHVIAQNEDDRTIYAFDSKRCTEDSSFVHPFFTEPSNEDEQLICDPLTMSAGGRQARAIAWLREPEAGVVHAYGMPALSCPLPTFTHFLGPSRATAGQQVRLCASVATRWLEGDTPLQPGQSLDFYVNARKVGSGQVLGDVACTSVAAGQLPGTYSVRAAFTGSVQYLPSADTGPLTLIGGTLPLLPPTHNPPAAAVAPPPPPVPNAPPAPAPPIQAQSVPQTLPQAQAQGVTQGVVAAERQPQVEPQTAAALNPELSADSLAEYALAPIPTVDNGLALRIAASLGTLGLISWLAYAIARAVSGAHSPAVRRAGSWRR